MAKNKDNQAKKKSKVKLAKESMQDMEVAEEIISSKTKKKSK